MDNNNVIAGQEVLIKTPRSGRFRFYGWDTVATIVTRVTKARIFVKHTRLGAPDGELEFNKDLTERSGGSYDHRRELVVDPAEIAKIRETQAAEKARRALESDGAVAFEALASKFSPAPVGGYNRIANRSDDEIKALIAAVEALLAQVKS
jgi:hypothetical protein